MDCLRYIADNLYDVCSILDINHCYTCFFFASFCLIRRAKIIILDLKYE